MILLATLSTFTSVFLAAWAIGNAVVDRLEWNEG